MARPVSSVLGTLIKFFRKHNGSSEIDTDFDIPDGNEPEATKYVREIILSFAEKRIERITISNNDGMAFCEHTHVIVPFNNVRNRVSAMTNTIVHYKTNKDQIGIIECIVHGVKFKIDVIDYAGITKIDFLVTSIRA